VNALVVQIALLQLGFFKRQRMQQWQHKGRRLAGAGLGNAEHVAPG
jgi:hypothetical protein